MLSSATLRNDIKRFPKNIFQNSLLVLRKVVCLSCRNNNSNMKTEQYPILAAHFDNRIAKLQSVSLGLLIGTPALVTIVFEILIKTL